MDDPCRKVLNEEESEIDYINKILENYKYDSQPYLLNQEQSETPESQRKVTWRVRDYPNWFRGTSLSQRDATEELLNNIRDDTEQNTTHRVRETLHRIGISPVVGSKRIKLAMRLSRGNDIAFLWFLMELYYRGSRKDEYSINEQLVMTAIAHLDIVPTIRALDKILPKPRKKPKKVEEPKKVPKRKPTNVSPYLAKQVRPLHYGKTLTMNPIGTAWAEYKKYLDPNVVIHNESSRWFANYVLNPNRRIAMGVLDTEINAMFDTEPKTQPGKALCTLHTNRAREEKFKERKVAVTNREIKRKGFDIEGAFKEQSARRVKADLEQRMAEEKQKMDNELKTITDIPKMCAAANVNEQKCRNSPKVKVAEEEENLDFGHADKATSKRVYFQAPTHHTPYKFNYAEIFELGARDPVKEAVHESLGGTGRDVTLDHGARIEQLCQELWDTSMEASTLKKLPEPELKPLEIVEDLDPYNYKLMSTMLEDALKEIKKNKKYVLASFPDAHKAPFLKEFVRTRYGFRYTRQGKIKSFKQSKRVMTILMKNEIKLRIPRTSEVSAKTKVSSACKAYLQKKSNYLRALYYKQYQEALMDRARMYWRAVRPFQCADGPPRRVFFAYLPARVHDIMTFKPWRPYEHIKAKDEWDRRQRMKRTADFS